MTKEYKRTCDVEGCEKTYRGGRTCPMHRMRLRVHGDVHHVSDRFSLQKRIPQFWARVKVTANSDRCWEWTGYCLKSGHGVTSRKAEVMLAHRFAWFITHGEVPSGLHVLHSCDNPPCVNPNHLFLGTHQDNVADMVSKGRQQRGERCHLSKYTEDVVRLLKERLRSGWTVRKCSEVMGIPYNTVGAINRGYSWKHV
jgi:hypothetical protein